MPGRTFVSATGYRFGFNGKEKTDEVSGSGNNYDYGFRIYNPRLGKFLSVDPLTKSYPWYTPYQFAGNTPIAAIDIDGLEEYLVINYYNTSGELVRSMIRMVKDKNNKTVNRNYTSADKINHASALVHSIDINSNGKFMGESFSNSFTKEQERAVANIKYVGTLKRFLNQDGQGFADADVYEADIVKPTPTFKEIKINKEFNFNSGEATFENKSKAEKDIVVIAEKLKEDPENKVTITVETGWGEKKDLTYGDPTVKIKTGKDLVEQRGESVSGLLLKMGVQPNQITTRPRYNVTHQPKVEFKVNAKEK